MTTSKTRENFGLVATVYLAVFTVIIGTLAALGVWWQITAALLIAMIGSATCIIAMTSRRNRLGLARWLRQDDFADLYLFIARPASDRLWAWCAPDMPNDAGFWRSLGAALNWRLYDLALLIAVAYPVILLYLPWFYSGSAVTLGDTLVVPAIARFNTAHLTALAIFLLFLVPIVLSVLPKYRRPPNLSRLHVLLILSFGLFAAAILLDLVVNTLILACAVLVPLASVAVFSVAGAIAVSFTTIVVIFLVADIVLSSPLQGLLAGVFALSKAAVVLVLTKRGNGSLAYVFLTLALATATIVAAISGPFAETGELIRGMFIFFALFPLINAIFDTLSYALTLTLARAGLNSPRQRTILLALADIVVALVLFAALGAVLVSAVAALNHLARVELLPLGQIIAGLGADPFPSELTWVLLMVFSTLLPTLAHLSVAVLSLQAFAPQRLRQALARRIATAETQTPLATVGAWITFGALCAAPFVVVLTLWHALAVLFAPITQMVLTVYLHLLGYLSLLFGL